MKRLILALLIIILSVSVCFYMLENDEDIQNTSSAKEPICGNNICEEGELRTCCSHPQGLDVCMPCPNGCPEDCLKHICGNMYCNPAERYVLIEHDNQNAKVKEGNVHGSFHVLAIIDEATIEAEVYGTKYILGINDEISAINVKLLNITLIESEKITCPQDCE